MTFSMISRFSLKGNCALVNGATGSLGHAIAEALRDAGARMTAVARSERVHGLGPGGFMCLRADLSRAGNPTKIASYAIESLGELDILVNPYGVATRGPSEIFPEDQWYQTLTINLTSVFELAQAAAIHYLKKKRGEIISIASMLSFTGGLHALAYAASNGEAAQLTKALANEWAVHGIKVNAIAPGYFSTPMMAALRADPIRNQQTLDRLPAGRWGEPNDIKGALVFLASEASAYIHGIILPVDGGDFPDEDRH